MTGNLAVAYNRLGEVEHRMGLTRDALEAFQTAAALARRLLAIDSSSTWARTLEAEALSRQGELHLASGDWKGAAAKYEESARLDESLAKADPHDVQARRNAADSRYHLCQAQAQLNLNAEALASCKAAIDHWTALLAAKPGLKAVHADLAYGYEKAGEVRQKLAHHDEACSLFAESLKHWRQEGQTNPVAVERVEQRAKSCAARQ